MSDEEKAREIAKKIAEWICDEDAESPTCVGLIAAALREARTEGARRGLERAAELFRFADGEPGETCYVAPGCRYVEHAQEYCGCDERAVAIRALDPEEVAR